MLPAHTWIPLQEAVTETGRRLRIARDEACAVVKDAVRNNQIYSRGRLYHAQAEPPFRINPDAWAAMDIDFVVGVLIPPHRGQLHELLPHQIPFLRSPIVRAVELHRGSVAAWLNSAAPPAVPLMATVNDPDSFGPLLFGAQLPDLTPDVFPFPEDPRSRATRESGKRKRSETELPRARGRRGYKGAEVRQKMAKMNRETLENMSEKEMNMTFGVSRDTCRRARIAVLADKCRK